MIRGKWGSKTFDATAAPTIVPALKDNTVSATLSVWDRLAEHRSNAACASCHNFMIQSASLENFDAVGRWRTFEEASLSTIPAACRTATGLRASPGLSKAC